MTKQVSKFCGLFTGFAGSLMVTDAPAVGKDLNSSGQKIFHPHFIMHRASRRITRIELCKSAMVPHSVANYQVSKKCKSSFKLPQPRNSRLSGATRISPTHFMDRDEKQVQVHRHVVISCLQCQQVSSKRKILLFQNDFKPMSGVTETNLRGLYV